VTERPPREDGRSGPAAEEPPESLLSLERVEEAWLDRALPARPGPFLGVALGLPAALWVAALLLAPDAGRFVRAREWIAQPLYLAVHLVVLRLFVTAYVRNFLAGARHLDLPPAAARRRVRRVLGPLAFLASLAVAAPFALADLDYLRGEDWLGAGGLRGLDGPLGPVDVLVGALWTVEWVVNAYVWVILLGFLVLTMRVLRRHRWRAGVETVLHERHYRPFLLMSAQGASVVLFFTVATAAYIWTTQGEATDYVGLWATGALLVFGFVPPWMRLKNDLSRQTRAEVDRLRDDVIAARRARRRLDDASPPTTLEELGARLNVVLSLLEVDNLERLHRDLGKNESQAVLLRLLAPLSTVAWRVIRP
jgi:hypothetical protein